MFGYHDIVWVAHSICSNGRLEILQKFKVVGQVRFLFQLSWRICHSSKVYVHQPWQKIELVKALCFDINFHSHMAMQSLHSHIFMIYTGSVRRNPCQADCFRGKITSSWASQEWLAKHLKCDSPSHCNTSLGTKLATAPSGSKQKHWGACIRSLLVWKLKQSLGATVPLQKEFVKHRWTTAAWLRSTASLAGNPRLTLQL